MGILDRYIFAHVILGSLLVWLVLGALDSFFVFLGEMDEVGRGNYGYLQVFLFMLYTLPRRLYEYAPTSVLLGSLLALGGLAARSELIAMRAAGMSMLRFTGAALKAGLLIAVVTFLLGEWLAPAAEQAAVKLRTEALSKRLALNSASGLWVRDGARFVHARGAISENQLMGITVYEFEGTRLQRLTRASIATAAPRGWDLQEVQHLRFDGEQVQRETVATEHWPRLVEQSLFDVLRVSPEEMSALALRKFIDYQRQNGLESGQYELAFWNRFMTPLSTLVMLVLAIPFVFGSQRSGGAGQRIFVGIMLGIGYFLGSNLLNQLGLVYGLPPLLSSVGPLLLFLGLGMALMRRV